MKLDINCIRAVLLGIEKLHQYTVDEFGRVENHSLNIERLYKETAEYSRADVFYTANILDQSGYIDITTQWGSGYLDDCEINGITYAGHQLLAKIQDERRWGKVKTVLASCRDYSLDAIKAAAEGITSAGIEAALELME